LLALAERGVRIGIPEIADYEVRRELLVILTRGDGVVMIAAGPSRVGTEEP